MSNLNEELETIQRQLAEYANEYMTLSKEAAEARVTYDIAWATELLKIQVKDNGKAYTVAEKEAIVLLTVQSQFTLCRIAEAKLDACKQRLRSLDSQLGAIQSRAKMMQTEREMDRYIT